MAAVRTEPILRLIQQLAHGHDFDDLSDSQLLRRFVQSQNDAAFAMLLRRHGPMVYGVCRRILGNEADADDAFQATFLVLIRRAGSIRRRQSLGSWLHGVALRLSHRACANSARRRLHETSSPPVLADAAPQLDPELRLILDEELDRLHEKYRAPLVLCYLEGKTIAEAAQQLGWPHGTLCGRLARARDRLRIRLTSRGLAPALTTAAVALGSPEVMAAVPHSLLAATVRLAGLLTSSEAVTAGVSASVAALVDGAMKSLLWVKVKAAAAVLVTASVLTAGAVWAGHSLVPAFDEPKPNTTEKSQAPAPFPTSRVDAYGDPLPAEAMLRLGTVRYRTGGFNTFVRFSPDGKHLITQGRLGVSMMDSTTGREVYTLPIETTKNHASLSNDGKLLATACESGVHIWNALTGAHQRAFGDGNTIRVCISPDGKTVATNRLADGGRHVTLFEAASGNALWSWHEDGVFPGEMAFSMDGKTLILAAQGRESNLVYFLAAPTGREQQHFDVEDRLPKKFALSADGTMLAAACDGRRSQTDHVLVWDLPSGKEKYRFDSPPEEDQTRQKIFSALTFTPDSKSLITSGGSDGLVVWDMATGNEQRRLGTQCTNSYDFTFSPDGKSIAVTRGSAVVVLDAATGNDRHPELRTLGPVNSAIFTKDGKQIVTISGSSDVRFWDRATGRPQGQFDRRGGAFKEHCTLADDAETVVVFKEAEKVLIFRDLRTGNEKSRLLLDYPGNRPYMFCNNAKGPVCAVGNFNGDTIYLLDTGTGRRLHTLHDPELKVRTVSFIDSGKKLFVGCNDHSAQIWDVASGKQLHQFAMGDKVETYQHDADGVSPSYSLAISPDEKLVAYYCYGGFGGQQLEEPLRLFELPTGKKLPVIGGMGNAAGRLWFSPDSRVLAATARNSPGVHFWELATGNERHAIHGHRGSVHGITFSKDGKTLISGGDDTTALVWDLTGRLSVPDFGKPLSAAQLDALWTDLASDGAAKAYKAIRRLASAPESALAFLSTQLKPATATDDAAFPPSKELLQSIRAIEALELAGTAEAKTVLQSLAKGAPAARLTQEAKASLDRLTNR